MKLRINEHQYKNLIKILNTHLISEQDIKSTMTDIIKNLQSNFYNMEFSPDVFFSDKKSSSGKSNIRSDNSYDSNEISIEPGDYYVHPNYNEVKIDYRPSAIKLNSDAEILLKSIAAKAGMKSITVSSTLRDYVSQARENKSNTDSELRQWYCRKGQNDCDEFIRNVRNMELNQLADYYKERDERNGGKKMSNHLNNLAIDIVPYDEKLSNIAKDIKKEGKSGIKKVFPEPGNAVHIEFEFPVTGQSGVKSPTLTKVKPMDGENVIDNGSVIIVTKNKNSNEYSLVYGGIPKDKHGAKFMYKKGENAKKLKNKNMIYSNHDVPINFIETDIKKINPNAKIKSVTGFSAGQKFTLPAMRTGNYEFIGLIDPYIPKFISSLPANTVMISNHNQWGSYPEAITALKQMEDSKISKFENIPHLEMPKKFFEEYGELM